MTTQWSKEKNEKTNNVRQNTAEN